jgi:translocation and assembly module TamA
MLDGGAKTHQLLRLAALFLFVCLLLPVGPADAAVELELHGLPKELQPLISDALVLPGALKAEGPVNPLWLNHYLKQLPRKLQSLLEPLGYYHAQLQTTQKAAGDQIKLLVQIDLGPPVILVERRIELAENLSRRPQLSLKAFPLKVGDVLRQDYYEKGKSELLAQLRDQGFLGAQFVMQRLEIDRELNQARIRLEIQPGVRSRFGAINFEGADDYPEKFLRRYLAFESGQVFDDRRLGQTQKSLRDADLFQRVLVVPQLDQAEGEDLPVTIELTPRKRYSLRPGIGYGTDTGARVGLSFRDQNVWQLGHRFELNLLEAERLRNLTGSYRFPGYQNRDTELRLHGGYRAENLDSYASDSVYLEAEQSYGFNKNRIGAIFVRGQFERSDIAANSLYNGFLMPGLRYHEIQLPEKTGKGYGFQFRGEIRFARQNFFSDFSLTQILADGNLVLELLPKLSLRLRAQGATSLLDDPLADIPVSLRFFAGGDRSVRGYAYQSLGPRNDDGQIVGGKQLVAGSIELTRKVHQNWGLALFTDAGNAFNRWDDLSLAVGAGFGVRYTTPVGPLQIDLANPVSEKKFSPRLHLGIGFGW